MNPFVNRLAPQAWVWPVTAMCVVLGFMVSIAWVTRDNLNTRINLVPADQRERLNLANADIQTFQKLSAEVNKLQADKTELENAIAKRGEDTSILNKSLQDLKMFAGTTKLVGPGVVITLKDSPRAESEILASGSTMLPESAIHDGDVLKVVNELYSTGAEAVSVNNHRVAGSTSFRCVGPTILVNDIKVASPIVIRAIGDTDTLFGGMNLPGGVLTEIRMTDPAMVQIEKVKEQEIPAFVGKTSVQYAKVPDEKPAVPKK